MCTALEFIKQNHESLKGMTTTYLEDDTVYFMGTKFDVGSDSTSLSLYFEKLCLKNSKISLGSCILYYRMPRISNSFYWYFQGNLEWIQKEKHQCYLEVAILVILVLMVKPL